MDRSELLRKSRAHRQLHLDTVDRSTFRRFVRYLKSKVANHFDGVAERTVFLKFNVYEPQHPDEIEVAKKANEEAADISLNVIHNLINAMNSKWSSTKKK